MHLVIWLYNVGTCFPTVINFFLQNKKYVESTTRVQHFQTPAAEGANTLDEEILSVGRNT